MKKILLLGILLLSIKSYSQSPVYTPFFRDNKSFTTYTLPDISLPSVNVRTSTSKYYFQGVRSSILLFVSTGNVTEVSVHVDKQSYNVTGFMASDKTFWVLNLPTGSYPHIRRTVDIDKSLSIDFPYYVVVTEDLYLFLPSLITEKIFISKVQPLFKVPTEEDRE